MNQRRRILNASRAMLLKAAKSCGANADGGGGFQPGNTCAASEGGSVDRKIGITDAGSIEHESINDYSTGAKRKGGGKISVNLLHGTSEDFDDFSFDYAGSGSRGGSGTGDGFFFAEDEDHANYWANHSSDSTQNEPKVMAVEVKIDSYLEFDVAAFIESNHRDAGYPVETAIEMARDEHDAIRFLNAKDSGDDTKQDYWFVFDPGNIEILE